MSFNVDCPASWGRRNLRWKDVVNAYLCKKQEMEKCHCTSDKADCSPTHYEWNRGVKQSVSTYNFFSFWDLKGLIAALGIPDHTHLKLHHQFVALIHMYLYTKNQLYIWWAKIIFIFNLRNRFLQDIRFQQNHRIMGHD